MSRIMRERGLFRSSFASQTAYQYCGKRATKPERRGSSEAVDGVSDFTVFFFLD